jgi:hypothetical protein
MTEQLISPESPLSRVVIETIPPTHEDDRRSIVEFLDSETDRFSNAKVIRVKQPEEGKELKLGNHYHEDVELFFLDQGEIDTLVLIDPQTGERMERKNIPANTRIVLPPKVAHLLVFKQPALLLAFSENKFDINNLVKYDIEPQSK